MRLLRVLGCPPESVDLPVFFLTQEVMVGLALPGPDRLGVRYCSQSAL